MGSPHPTIHGISEGGSCPLFFPYGLGMAYKDELKQCKPIAASAIIAAEGYALVSCAVSEALVACPAPSNKPRGTLTSHFYRK